MSIDCMPFWLAPDGEWSFLNYVLNTDTTKITWFFQIPESVTITQLGFKYGARKGSPPTFRISLRQSNPDGTPGLTNLATTVFRPPQDDSWNKTFQWVTLDFPYAAVRGEFLCATLEYASGSISGSNNSSFEYAIANTHFSRGWFPYVTLQNGADARSTVAGVFGWRSNSRIYGLPAQTLEFNDVNFPKQAGLRFLLKNGFGSSYSLAGARFQGRLSQAAGKSFDMVLYNAENVELARGTFKSGWSSQPLAADCVFEFLFQNLTLPTLDFGTDYFLAFAPNEIDTKFNIRVIVLPGNVELIALPGAKEFYYAERADSSQAWDEQKNRRPIVDLIPGDWSE